MAQLVLIALTCLITTAMSGTYTDKWDNINVDEILESDRLLKAYVECLMDRGRCTPDGKELKETMPDALEHECEKCTEKQKTGADKIIGFLINKREELWKELATKYDPNDEYQHRYKDKIDNLKN